MCGIWGSIGLGVPKAVIRSVVHRGPDGEGWHEQATRHGPLVLAHRRLSIVDVSARGAQPMTWPGRDVWLTYNGEVYNHAELRRELVGLGYEFRSSSDTEVIVAAYLEWGEASFARLTGMFAFVLWDGEKRRLVAVRDRFAVKPLYVFGDARGICFASEIKQILAVPGVPRRMNEQRCTDFLVAGLTDHEEDTMFAGIRHVRGGECITVDVDRWSPGDGVPTPRRWYSAGDVGTLQVKGCEAAGRYRLALADAVRSQMRADVPRGISLSGGLDSSAIACLVAEERDGGLWDTFSSCSDDPGVDERRYIDAVLNKTGFQSHRTFCSPDDVFARLDELVWHMDEPFGGTSPVAQWSMFASARARGVSVVLGGQGADEQLGGYRIMVETRRRELGVRRDRLAAGTIWARTSPIADEQIEAPAWLVRERTPHPRSWPGLPPPQATSNLGEMCRYLLGTGSLPMLLRYEDRNSMAHSVESRVPFLDHRVVELALALGSEHKIVGGVTKYLLRRGLEDVMPREVVHRRDKIGFTTPEQAWLCGPLRSAIDGRLDAAVKRWPSFFVPSGAEMLKHGLAASSGSPLEAWRVVCFDTWAERFGMAA